MVWTVLTINCTEIITLSLIMPTICLCESLYYLSCPQYVCLCQAVPIRTPVTSHCHHLTHCSNQSYQSLPLPSPVHSPYLCRIQFHWVPIKSSYSLHLSCCQAGDRGSTVVKVLCYISEGRWFDSRRYQRHSSLT